MKSLCVVVVLALFATFNPINAQIANYPQPHLYFNTLPYSAFQFTHLADPQIGFGSEGVANDTLRFRLAATDQYGHNSTIVLLAGDLTNAWLDPELQGFQTVYPYLFYNIPVLLVPGNHDVLDLQTLQRYRTTFGPDYHSFTYNNCDFICLNSIVLTSNFSIWTAEHNAQWNWMVQTFQASKAAKRNHIFVVHHHPPFLTTEDEPDSYWNWPIAFRKPYLDLIRQYGITGLIVGHRHTTFTATPKDNKFTIYSVGGTSLVYDPSNGYGYRLFKFNSDNTVSQAYHQIKWPV